MRDGEIEHQHLPLIRLGHVALRVGNGGDAVEAANSENHVVDYLQAKVAAGVVHLADEVPGLRLGIVAFAGGQSGSAIETSDHIDLTAEGNTGHSGAPMVHVGYTGPDVGLRVEELSAVQALLAIESSCNRERVRSVGSPLLQKEEGERGYTPHPWHRFCP